MRATPLRDRYTVAQYVLIVLFLLGLFFLRVHRPLEQPAFVDEDHHIRRGEIVYAFDRNPATFSHGKLLFYYWIGLFWPGGDGALATGRLAVALFSLITGAVIIAIARALFGGRAVVPALLFYTLAPWAVFFERMALADPFAGGMAALVTWQSIRVARHRRAGRRMGIVLGLLLTAMLFGKLTTAVAGALPFVAVLMLNSQRPVRRDRAALRVWIMTLWDRYGLAWTTAAIVVGLAWVLYLIAMLCYKLSGETPMVFTGSLVDSTPAAIGVVDNLRDTLLGARYLLSIPMTASLFILTALMMRRRTAAGMFVLAWLVMLWGPVIAIGNPVKTRYLVTGLPALAVLFGGGVANMMRPWQLYTARNQPRGWHVQPGPARFQLAIVPFQVGTLGLVILGAVTLWALGFALPFAQTAASEPEDLDLMARDRYSYISSPYNGFGAREAVNFLVDNGARINGKIPAVGALKHCGSISLHVTHDFDWTCYDERNVPAASAFVTDISQWAHLAEALDQWPLFYLITEYPPPAGLMDHMALDWRPMFTYTRPRGGWTVTVWRIARHYP